MTGAFTMLQKILNAIFDFENVRVINLPRRKSRPKRAPRVVSSPKYSTSSRFVGKSSDAVFYDEPGVTLQQTAPGVTCLPASKEQADEFYVELLRELAEHRCFEKENKKDDAQPHG